MTFENSCPFSLLNSQYGAAFDSAQQELTFKLLNSQNGGKKFENGSIHCGDNEFKNDNFGGENWYFLTETKILEDSFISKLLRKFVVILANTLSSLNALNLYGSLGKQPM